MPNSTTDAATKNKRCRTENSATHISPRMIGSRNGLIMALSTHLRKGETWGKFFIVTIVPSVRLSNEGRQKAGQAPFRWYRLN